MEEAQNNEGKSQDNLSRNLSNNLNSEEAQNKTKSTKHFILEVIEVVVLAFAVSWVLHTFVFEARYVPSGSMLPTIQLGDRIIIDKFFYKHFGSIGRDDIIVFHATPSIQTKDDLVKRVIALPGDTVQISGHKVLINGKQVSEPFIMNVTVGDYGPVTVPQGSLFVMGDNRNNSDDSRDWGFLPISNVVGKVILRYWPLDNFGTLQGT